VKNYQGEKVKILFDTLVIFIIFATCLFVIGGAIFAWHLMGFF
jgi:hypothetical protein